MAPLGSCSGRGWAGVYLVDYWRRRGNYRTEDLVRARGGAYWYRGGVSWSALAALLIGIVAGGLVANTAKWQGYISIHYLGGADLSPIVGFGVGAILYYVFTSTGDFTPARATESLAAATASEA